METESTVNNTKPNKAHLIPYHFKPGQSGNPNGRPVGTRHLLQSKFFEDCYSLWQQKGPEALELMAAEKPNEFCRMIAMLMPAKTEVEKVKTPAQQALENATYEQLCAVISAANAIVVSGGCAAAEAQDRTGIITT